ncbi:hypothetical protein Cch01nite_44780 [Cellulomonas chitinilytica]|uniref:PPE family domain-containing protein n=1 Tax=Cellulomonas chitinilytica TaxID=398759 RepID=A0A919U531_9CELL|nr:hypothetical protein [Cellulomonas chitinilytica]GIG23754.1 hypothetical protein Cch01nite_44780 [Cellulomonas chitinilytica]
MLPPAASPTPAVADGLTISEWSHGPMTDFTSGVTTLGADWYRSTAGCQAAHDLATSARAADQPAEVNVAAAWDSALTAYEDMVAACWEFDATTFLAASDRYSAALRDTSAAMAAASS